MISSVFLSSDLLQSEFDASILLMSEVEIRSLGFIIKRTESLSFDVAIDNLLMPSIRPAALKVLSLPALDGAILRTSQAAFRRAG